MSQEHSYLPKVQRVLQTKCAISLLQYTTRAAYTNVADQCHKPRQTPAARLHCSKSTVTDR